MAAKLPEMRMNRKGQRIRLTPSPESSLPVRSARTSVTVGRRVNVKMVASKADQKRMKMNAIHGTPGWKYWRGGQSRSANGRRKKNQAEHPRRQPNQLIHSSNPP